ncbi:hypothetical protein MUO14_00320 [Halobacillus shinanisalinarum]|uniref:HD domain-containing protein n=1 Tax=Halobacillus shinanisalinarum TaxID=2932258 RepID=A0ABY4GZF2_9BACI|nr:hypothetical protein MUO14_00320 [Halobacillus shinanisalinarum]
MGGSVEEQIAGLLHDVSHTAFSHVIDFALGNEKEDYHEKIYQKVVMGSEIPGILEKYGYHYKDILIDDPKWTLLEQPAPLLCADRVDYTLRDMYRYDQISLEEAREFLNDLIVHNGRMHLDKIVAAEWFVETYYKEVIGFFMDPLNIYGNHVLSKTLKLAMDKQILTLDDFLKTDQEVISIIKSSKDPRLENLLSQIHDHVGAKEDQTNYDIHIKNKVRLIDPPILLGEGTVMASEVSRKVKVMGENALKKSVKGIYVKVVSN